VRGRVEWCKRLAAKCEAAIEHFNPSENSDDDGVIKKSVVSKRLSILIGSFPNAVPHSAEAYTRMLVEEVAAFDELDTIILESICREIARTHKFSPSISEVLKVLGDHNECWDNRYSAIWHTEETLTKAIEARVKWEAEQERKEWERKLYVARRDLQTANENVASCASDVEMVKAHLGIKQSYHQASVEETDKKVAEFSKLETRVAAELSETLTQAIAAREKWKAEQKLREAEQKRKEWEQKLNEARRDLYQANKTVASIARDAEIAKARVEIAQSFHQASIEVAEKKAAELPELETLVAAELAKLDADEATATKRNSEAADAG
jgi:hypothetical protein